MNSQEYIEVAVKITPFSEENAEIVTAEVSELPFESFTVEEPYLKCYIQKELFNQQALKVVLDGINEYYSKKFGFEVKTAENPLDCCVEGTQKVIELFPEAISFNAK